MDHLECLDISPTSVPKSQLCLPHHPLKTLWNKYASTISVQICCSRWQVGVLYILRLNAEFQKCFHDVSTKINVKIYLLNREIKNAVIVCWLHKILMRLTFRIRIIQRKSTQNYLSWEYVLRSVSEGVQISYQDSNVSVLERKLSMMLIFFMEKIMKAKVCCQ